MNAPSHIPPELINDFDIYDDRLVSNFRHCLDDLPPVSYTTANGGHWIIQGYKEITAAMRDPKTFSSWPASLPADLAKGRGRFIPLEYDPPEHSAYRSVLSSYFSVGRVRELDSTFRALARSLIDQFADLGECDFMESFARPFPAMMFLGLMGWPQEKMTDFCAWVDGFQHGGGGLSDDARVKNVRAESIASAYDYFRGFVRARREEPGDDITSALVQAVLPDGRHLTENEILDYIFLLLIAGLHTVEGALAFGVMHFATHPEDRQRVIDEPKVLVTTVEELLRLEPPAWGTGRVAAREVTIGGVTIRPGEKVLLPHQTANLDPAVFPDPDRFDPQRMPNAHVSFGGGPHRCMGAHLARIELRVAFEELHSRIQDYTLDQARPPVQHMSQTRGVASLHIRFSSPPSATDSAVRAAG